MAFLFSYEGPVYRNGEYVGKVDRHETRAWDIETATRHLKYQIYQDADIPKDSLEIDEELIRKEE
ncbi:MAG: hypothetical protein IJJ13_02770 [Lachnospiraceae bacterium]|nr:hypothetical protein [Lachnospiraceae bacterium]